MSAFEVTTPHRPSWLPGLMMALIGFAVWTLFSLWPWLMNSHAPFRVREAWDTTLFWHIGVPVMLLAQCAGSALSEGKIYRQPLGMLGGFLAGVLLVHPAGSDFGMMPLAAIMIGIPAYLALFGAAAVGRMLADYIGK
ncbi:MAG: hypothetical protein PS018_09565 [bacterium]|nr:hypothetical protein [bacterium]